MYTVSNIRIIVVVAVVVGAAAATAAAVAAAAAAAAAAATCIVSRSGRLRRVLPIYPPPSPQHGYSYLLGYIGQLYTA